MGDRHKQFYFGDEFWRWPGPGYRVHRHSQKPSIRGFGFGDGSVDMELPIPPDVSLRGRAFFSQWLVLDPDADSGIMSASQGLIHVVGS